MGINITYLILFHRGVEEMVAADIHKPRRFIFIRENEKLAEANILCRNISHFMGARIPINFSAWERSKSEKKCVMITLFEMWNVRSSFFLLIP